MHRKVNVHCKIGLQSVNRLLVEKISTNFDNQYNISANLSHEKLELNEYEIHFQQEIWSKHRLQLHCGPKLGFML